MNRFLTHTGRQPIWLDDLNFIQDSFADEVKKIVQGIVGLTNDPVILTGCEVTTNEDGSYRISEGIIYYDGELFRLEDKTYTSVSTLRLRKQITFDENGDRVLMDSGEEVSCYSIRKIVLGLPIVSMGKPDLAPAFSSCKRLSDIFNEYSAEKTLYTFDHPAPLGDEDHYFRLYKKIDSYYLDFSFRCKYEKLVSFQSAAHITLDDDVDVQALGVVDYDSLANTTFWKNGNTYCSCIGYGSGKAVPIGIRITTSRVSEKKIRLGLDFSPMSDTTIDPSTEIRGGFHTKLNTL